MAGLSRKPGLKRQRRLPWTRKLVMNPILLIPARMASTRLPAKPLADIAGRAHDRAGLRQADGGRAGAGGGGGGRARDRGGGGSRRAAGRC